MASVSDQTRVHIGRSGHYDIRVIQPNVTNVTYDRERLVISNHPIPLSEVGLDGVSVTESLPPPYESVAPDISRSLPPLYCSRCATQILDESPPTYDAIVHQTNPSISNSQTHVTFQDSAVLTTGVENQGNEDVAIAPENETYSRFEDITDILTSNPQRRPPILIPYTTIQLDDTTSGPIQSDVFTINRNNCVFVNAFERYNGASSQSFHTDLIGQDPYYVRISVMRRLDSSTMSTSTSSTDLRQKHTLCEISVRKIVYVCFECQKASRSKKRKLSF